MRLSEDGTRGLPVWPVVPLRRRPHRRMRGSRAVITRFALGTLLVLGSVASAAAEHVPAYEARFGRTRPVIAVAGENSGTELTDFVIPYGILSASGAADVFTVASSAGPMQLRPALRIQPDLTLRDFDHRYPDGADYVIVPALMTMGDEQPLLVDWIRAQADRGATIVSICDGAFPVAQAGVFKGHRATGHWATHQRRVREFPETRWLRNSRYVADGKVISSAGVSASIPVSLALVEAIAGVDRATNLAHELGVEDWRSDHDSERFRLGAGGYALAFGNWLHRPQTVGMPIADGIDEITLALSADAFSRTYRSRAFSMSHSRDVVRSRHGLAVLPDAVTAESAAPDYLRSAPNVPSAQSLDHALADIAKRYGRRTASFVALQLEYPQRL